MSILKFCPNCNITKTNAELKASLAATGTRYKKEDVLEFNKGFLWGIKPKDGGEYKSCPFCGTAVIDSNISQEDFSIIEDVSNCNRQFLEAMIKLHDEDIIEYELKMSQFRTQIQQQEQISKQVEESSRPKCPKCGSTSITSGARGVNFTFGLIGASKTVNRCANCGHTWKPGK